MPLQWKRKHFSSPWLSQSIIVKVITVQGMMREAYRLLFVFTLIGMCCNLECYNDEHATKHGCWGLYISSKSDFFLSTEFAAFLLGWVTKASVSVSRNHFCFTKTKDRVLLGLIRNWTKLSCTCHTSIKSFLWFSKEVFEKIFLIN